MRILWRVLLRRTTSVWPVLRPYNKLLDRCAALCGLVPWWLLHVSFFVVVEGAVKVSNIEVDGCNLSVVAHSKSEDRVGARNFCNVGLGVEVIDALCLREPLCDDAPCTCPQRRQLCV